MDNSTVTSMFRRPVAGKPPGQAEACYRRRIERRLVWEQGPAQEVHDNAGALLLLGIAVLLLSAVGIGPYVLWYLA
ncbi:MAG: hypothetical protein H7A35_00785 [Planctomycetales bacterium]|nr:hypothetical protein [bacterium]UNM08597.1 MAG: hypothetical protein H7A35_00785 [Planctomycetales bacterium]